MATAYTPPAISVTYDMETDEHVLMATNYGRAATAGERLFRAEPHPRIKFRHATADAAEADAETLRVYLEECATGKRKEAPAHGSMRDYWSW